MKVARLAFVVLTIGALIGPACADGQLVGAVYGARARDSFGGTNGFGGLVGVSLPLMPLEVFGAGTWFGPSCNGCDLSGWSLGMNLRVFPIPVLRPYLTFGRTWRNLEDPSDGLIFEDDGFFGGAGVEIALPGFGLFGEGRYEFLTEDPSLSTNLRQWVFRGGLILRWGGLPI